MSEYLLIAILAIATPITLGLIRWGAAELRALIRQHVNNTQVAGIMTRLTYAVEVAVGDTSQTYARALKDLSADGKLTPAEAYEAAKRAESKVRLLLGPEGVEEAVKVLGPSPDALLAAIEAEVAKARAKGIR